MALREGPPREAPQGRDDEDVERHERGGGVAREGEDGHAALGRGDRGEGGGLARLDLHAPEVDRPVEVPLDDGLEQVARAHARASGGDDDVGLVESLLERCYVVLEAELRFHQQLRADLLAKDA